MGPHSAPKLEKKSLLLQGKVAYKAHPDISVFFSKLGLGTF